MKKKMPKTVFVRWEKDGDSEYLLADEKPDGEDGDMVGVYVLKETRKLKTHEPTLD